MHLKTPEMFSNDTRPDRMLEDLREVAWGTAVMELQSWLLYHLVAVTDCNQGTQMLTV
ncbi:hypothetical protein K0M31_019019 [Melipona bicolor]|uniref:Uncharacterized protein n=1 Tax=Melipona bicolor TaxID=60889 RepID=A0AA40FCJ6_9HYME|nr:hypothetical protein K0M31_019019 [Melipona bicolor]